MANIIKYLYDIITPHLKYLLSKNLFGGSPINEDDDTKTLKINKINYDIKTWYNMKKDNHIDDLCINSTEFNNSKPMWLIRYDLSSLHYRKIHIYNIPPEMKFNILYDVINDKISDHLLHGDSGNYIYSTFIEVCENIPDLTDLDFTHINIWLTPCKYIVKPTIRHNTIMGLDVLNFSENNNSNINIDLSKCHNINYYFFDVKQGINIISLPFNVYIKKHMTPKIIL